MNIDKKQNEVGWFDNPGMVINVIIGLIAVIIILSQSFAVNSNLSTIVILKNIVNHNSIYLITLVYFVALKTYTGKKYFNFLNLFLIVLYLLTSITSLLTVFQSFSLTSFVNLALHFVLLIYLVHLFFRGTRIWKDFKLEKSPFNEVKNDSYFYIVTILDVTLLALNLIFTTSFDGTVLAILDCLYIILFARYIYLYGVFLDGKENKTCTNNDLGSVKENIEEVVHDIKEVIEEKSSEVIDEIKEKLDDAKVDKTNNKRNKGTKKKGDE